MKNVMMNNPEIVVYVFAVSVPEEDCDSTNGETNATKNASIGEDNA